MTLLSRKNIKYFSVIVVLLLVVFTSFRGADNPAKGALLTVSSPFLKTFRIFSGGAAGFFDFLGSIGELKSENEKLLADNQKLIAENIRLKDTGKENEILRNQLGLSPGKNFQLEACFIIAQDPQGTGKYFIIDKGADKGVQVGMPAVISGSILVGRVSEVYPNTSKVVLITDPESAINAQIEESGAKGIIRGEYGLSLRMEMISQTEILNEGDTVITSGLGGELPRGLAIGKIGSISQSADRLFQQALLVPLVDYSDLRIIFLIKNG